MKNLVSLFLMLFCIPFSYAQTLEDALSLIAKKDYQGAINVLKSLNQDRKVSYYLSESYFLSKDFENAYEVSKKLISQKDDFYYQKALYNLVFSSYMLNRFSDTYTYGLEYLDKVGDSQGAETSILTFVINSLQFLAKIDEAQKILENYKNKYPNLYFVLSSSVSKYKSQIATIKNLPKEEKVKNKEEIEKLNVLYTEIIKDILSSLDKISSKKDAEIEKLEDIVSLLELKEEVLKIKKYKLILGE